MDGASMLLKKPVQVQRRSKPKRRSNDTQKRDTEFSSKKESNKNNPSNRNENKRHVEKIADTDAYNKVDGTDAVNNLSLNPHIDLGCIYMLFRVVSCLFA